MMTSPARLSECIGASMRLRPTFMDEPATFIASRNASVTHAKNRFVDA
jgi:hypothetical protein